MSFPPSNFPRGEKRRLRVVIVGGSISGLMCGLALKHAGHHVDIIEQGDNERQSHLSGVCLGPSAIKLLGRYDSSFGQSASFSLLANCIQVLRPNGAPRVLAKGQRIITSWELLYYRLRALFDEYSHPPPRPMTASVDVTGAAMYRTHTKVLGVKRSEYDTSKLEVRMFDEYSSRKYNLRADLVIGADGSGSSIRQAYLPGTERQFTSYVAWRSAIPEAQVSQTTQQAFNKGVTLHMLKQQHFVVYTIPGPDGSVEPGKRLLNFLWYTNEDEASLDQIMTDALDGHRHHTTVPTGHVLPEIWAERRERAQQLDLPPPWLELVQAIDRPFLQAITHVYSPAASFEDGQVLLVGDALAQICPHAGLSSAQAAFHATKVADYVAGKLSARQWEEEVLGYSYLYWLQSVYWGQYYQSDILWKVLVYGVHYWATVGLDKLRMWWQGKRRPNEFEY